MSWFMYGTIISRRRRRGVALRVWDIPPELSLKVTPLLREGEEVQLCLVKEVFPKDQVLLAFYARVPGKDPINRYSYITLVVDEDPMWVCEGDVGRGLREGDDKSPKKKRKKPCMKR